MGNNDWAPNVLVVFASSMKVIGQKRSWVKWQIRCYENDVKIVLSKDSVSQVMERSAFLLFH